MRAPRTRKILEVDVVAKAEDSIRIATLARLFYSNGVCVVGMHENVQTRNLGGPVSSKGSIGMVARNGTQVLLEERLEVGLPHSIWEAR